MIFRPHLTSRNNSNSIRELVKSYYCYGIPSPKIYILPESKFHSIFRVTGLEKLYCDGKSKAYKKLRKDYKLKGWINVYTSSGYDISELLKYNKSQPLISRANRPIYKDLFVLCKNETDNKFSELSEAIENTKKRVKLNKKIMETNELRILFNKGLLKWTFEEFFEYSYHAGLDF